MNKPLVSIIIPTYNRAHLIGETLDSILAQTYENWECIIVDDGSADETDHVVSRYTEKDKRFKYYHRPVNRPKGANACRNYGFEKSRGEFINWFDSDDLMLPNNLETKINAFKPEINFVVGNSLNFDCEGRLFPIFQFSRNETITAEKFIGGIIGWITDDVLIRKSTIKITFKENLNSSQEYNFFSRFLYMTNRGIFIKKHTVLRRVHDNSIQEKLKTDTKTQNIEAYENEWQLLNDIKCNSSIGIKKRSLKRLIRFSYQTSTKNVINRRQTRTFVLLVRNGFFKCSLYFLSWVLSNFIVGKGYFFLLKATHSIKFNND